MSNDDRENEQLVPIANVARIMKKGLPENAKISKEAKETVQECTTEFISFVASEASDRCLHEKRKTIVADDILWALESLGFDNYSTYLQKYLQEFRDVIKRKDKVEDDQDVVNPVTNAQFQMATLIGQHQSGRMNYEETTLPGMD